MRATQKLASGLVVRQDIADAVRPVFFKTDFEEWLYATHGGTLFLIRFRGRVYALTCNHVFKDFPTGRLFIVGKKYAQKGNLPARIEGVCCATSLRDGAVDSDIGDVCLIEFSERNPVDFFGHSPYIIEEKTVATSSAGHELFVAGVLKEKTSTALPDLYFGYCNLQLCDDGLAGHDPTLRKASAVFDKPDFKSVEGISGSPVFDRTANALCGMVVRGGMNGWSCNLIYVDIFDIMRLLEAVSGGKESTYYTKTLFGPAAR
jgi:hypothetical protein